MPDPLPNSAVLDQGGALRAAARRRPRRALALGGPPGAARLRSLRTVLVRPASAQSRAGRVQPTSRCPTLPVVA
jgi:hypothetical protein